MTDHRGIDLPGGRSEEDENIVVDTTSTEPLRKAAADEPEEIAALEEKLSRARRGNAASPRTGSAAREDAELEAGPGKS